jgi:homoserine kinase
MIGLVAARVRVPCSTSNLGSGFDTVGLALDRYLHASFEPADVGEVVVERTGTLARLDAEGEPDLVAETLRRTLARDVRSDIPVARGLGTSAAAVLAGYDLARAIRSEPRDDDAAFQAALRYEGHGDNAAPSLFGGLRAVARTGGDPARPLRRRRLRLRRSCGGHLDEGGS